MKKWKFLWEVRLTDSSNYNPDRCFNGGSYFYVKTSMFFTRLNKSKEEFCRLDLWDTSADFPYTSYGQFVREIVPVRIVDTDIEDLRYWLEQSDYDPIEWDDPVELASFAEPCTLEDALSAVDCEIDSKGNVKEMLSFDEKRERCDILDNIPIGRKSLMRLTNPSWYD